MAGVGKLGYRAALDGLRGVAIAFVVLNHAFGWPESGFLGVDLFFVLSGFLITTLLLEEQAAGDGISIRRFYARRARRLLPALGVLLIVLTPLLIVHAGLWRGLLWSAIGLAFSANIVMAHGSAFTPPLGPLWSLAQEEQFYVLWPVVLVLVASRRRILMVALTLGTAAAAWRQVDLIYTGAASGRILYAPDTRGLGIVAGCLAALALRSQLAEPICRLAAIFAVPAVALLVGVPVLVQARQVFLGGMLVFTLAALLVIVRSLDGGSMLAKALEVWPLVYLGRISYSLYLWNLPILLIVGRGQGVSAELIGLGTALIVASISYRYIEQPFLRRGTQGRERSAKLTPVPALGVS